MIKEQWQQVNVVKYVKLLKWDVPNQSDLFTFIFLKLGTPKSDLKFFQLSANLNA